MLLLILTLLLTLNVLGFIHRKKSWPKIFMIVQVSSFLIFTIMINVGANNQKQSSMNKTINAVKELLIYR